MDVWRRAQWDENAAALLNPMMTQMVERVRRRIVTAYMQGNAKNHGKTPDRAA
jgi:hypothetical protein